MLKKKFKHLLLFFLIFLFIAVCFCNSYQSYFFQKTTTFFGQYNKVAEKLIDDAIKKDNSIPKPTLLINDNLNLKYHFTYESKLNPFPTNSYTLNADFNFGTNDVKYGYYVNNLKKFESKKMSDITSYFGIGEKELRKKAYLTSANTINWIDGDNYSEIYSFYSSEYKPETATSPIEGKEFLNLQKDFKEKNITKKQISETIKDFDIDNFLHSFNKKTSYAYNRKQIRYVVNDDSVDLVEFLFDYKTPLNTHTNLLVSSRKIDSDRFLTKEELSRQWGFSPINSNKFKGELFTSKSIPEHVPTSAIFYFKGDYVYEFYISTRGAMSEKEFIDLIKDNLN